MSCASLGLNANNVSTLLNLADGSYSPFVITEEVVLSATNIVNPQDPTFFLLLPSTLSTGLATLNVGVQGEPKTGSFSQYNMTIGLYDNLGSITTYTNLSLVYVPDENLGNEYNFVANSTLIIPSNATKVGVVFTPQSTPYTDFTVDNMTVVGSFIQFTSK